MVNAGVTEELCNRDEENQSNFETWYFSWPLNNRGVSLTGRGSFQECECARVEIENSSADRYFLIQ